MSVITPMLSEKEKAIFLETARTLDTRTPYTADWTGADAGKVAHYLLRWVNTRGEKGPDGARQLARR